MAPLGVAAHGPAPLSPLQMDGITFPDNCAAMRQQKAARAEVRQRGSSPERLLASCDILQPPCAHFSSHPLPPTWYHAHAQGAPSLMSTWSVAERRAPSLQRAMATARRGGWTNSSRWQIAACRTPRANTPTRCGTASAVNWSASASWLLCVTQRAKRRGSHSNSFVSPLPLTLGVPLSERASGQEWRDKGDYAWQRI